VVSIPTVDPAPVSPEPSPTNAVAVIIPVVFTDPVEPIPTPVSPEPSPTNADAVTKPTTFKLLETVKDPSVTVPSGIVLIGIAGLKKLQKMKDHLMEQLKI
jgi:hypothetical protein